MMPFVGRLESTLTGRSPVKVTLPEDIIYPGEWVSAGYNGEGMVNAWGCGVALGLMVLGREESDSSKIVGRPNGPLDSWFI